MAEKDQDNTHEFTVVKLRDIASETKRGQIFGCVVTLAAFATATLLGYWGHPTAAGVIGGTTVVGLVGIFIRGRP